MNNQNAKTESMIDLFFPVVTNLEDNQEELYLKH